MCLDSEISLGALTLQTQNLHPLGEVQVRPLGAGWISKEPEREGRRICIIRT